ncbi:hypothetical protein GBE28_19330 [Salmonella enterica]|nr:hypothetical protein [Salmonella enterica]
MKQRKKSQSRCGLIDSCLIAVWLLLMMLTGFLMLMLAATQVQAAESDMPEVLRYAREYTRNRANQPALQPEVSQTRKLARSELIRRQQRARIEALEKQLKSRGENAPQADIIRLTRELDVSAETVRTLTQKLSQAQQENRRLQAEVTQADGKVKPALDAAQSRLRTLTDRISVLEKEKVALRVQQTAGNIALQQVQSNLKTRNEEVSRLTAELASVRENAVVLDKQKTELEKTLRTIKARPEYTVSLKTASERQAYAAGVMYARDVRDALDGNRMLGIDLAAQALNAGLNDALADHPTLRLDKKALAEATQALEKNAAEAFRTVTARQKTLAEDWLKTFRKEKGTLKDASGFWYRVTYEGNGEYLKPTDVVDVVVEERLPDGKVVSDMDRAGSSLRQKVADFPPVFATGLQYLKNHGQITLAVPPELAYGDRGYPPDVPPGAMMIYSIRVSDVIPVKPENVAEK